jgi:hypothetical protein
MMLPALYSDKPSESHTDNLLSSLAGAFILKVLYGYNMDYTGVDPLMDYIEKALERFIPALVPGTWLVDAFPVCTLVLSRVRSY